MYISEEIQIKATVQEGSVFYFSEESFKTDVPHNFVVLNHKPISEKIILLVCFTTFDIKSYQRIENSPCPSDTFISITPEQCPILKHISVVDCNRVYEKNIQELVDKLKNKKLKIGDCVNKDVLDSFRKAVQKSPTVENRIKKML